MENKKYQCEHGKRIVGEEITVNTTNRKPSVLFVVVAKYVLTTDRNYHVKNVER